MIRRHARALLIGLILGASLLAVGMYAGGGIFMDVVEDAEGCDPKPIGANPSWSLEIPKVAALCAALAVVDGRTYSVGAGGWFDEDALVLEEYGTISAANDPSIDPTVYALEGIDPLRLLVVYRDPRTEDPEDPGTFRALWGEPFAMPAGVCQYANPEAPGYPADVCPLTPGHSYEVAISMKCGLDVAQGPYGGEYWLVVDPPAGPPYPGMWVDDVEYGQLEVVSEDVAIYRSERGAELELRRIISSGTPPAPCSD